MDNVKRPICIAGLGTMGRSLAKLCASKGYTVKVISRTPESGKKGLDRLTGELKSRVDKGKLSLDEYSKITSRIILAKDISEFVDAEIIIEAIYEDEKAKEEFYRAIEPKIPENTVISTNTSSLSINELSGHMKHPSRFIGVHFFNPAEVMKLAEIRRSGKTGDSTAAFAIEIAKQLGKTPINVPDSPGMYVNRILFPMLLEGISVLETTKSPIKDIDDAMKLGANLPMGPFELCDFIGNDIVLEISEILLDHTGDLRFKPPELLRQMVREGRLGRKSGRGFYEYNK
jgi:3-hydroxybutyryl-CoA dehydrogenase